MSTKITVSRPDIFDYTSIPNSISIEELERRGQALNKFNIMYSTFQHVNEVLHRYWLTSFAKLPNFLQKLGIQFSSGFAKCTNFTSYSMTLILESKNHRRYELYFYSSTREAGYDTIRVSNTKIARVFTWKLIPDYHIVEIEAHALKPAVKKEDDEGLTSWIEI